jgi:DNA-binding XRE family transcriptional regulator
MTLEDYRIECAWSKNEMARHANMDITTLNRAMNGENVSIATAGKLARAISQKLGRSIPWQQIEGLNVKL